MNFLIKLFLFPVFDLTFSFPAIVIDPSNALRNPKLFDGDIVLRRSKNDPKFTDEDEFYNAIPNDNQLWPHGIIPYEIDPDLRDIIGLIESAFKHFRDKTCIRFKPRRDERDYIYIHSGGGEQKYCQSMVGLAGGRQEVNIGLGCRNLGTILHEFMHVVGFYHEHSRSDRDHYLDIHLENVIEGKEENFRILAQNENRLLSHFDYQSIMIYGETSFSKNNLPTMLAKNKEILTDPYFKTGFTHWDIEAINNLYHCRH